MNKEELKTVIEMRKMAMMDAIVFDNHIEEFKREILNENQEDEDIKKLKNIIYAINSKNILPDEGYLKYVNKNMIPQ